MAGEADGAEGGGVAGEGAAGAGAAGVGAARRAWLFETLKREALLRPGRAGEVPMTRAGRPAKWLFDVRRVLLSGRGLHEIAAAFWDRHAARWPFQVGGVEFSGAPLVAGIQLEGLARGFEVGGFVVRRERKTTGLCRQYEGRLDDRPIVLVDDILNSGTALERAMAVLAALGRAPASVFVVLEFDGAARPAALAALPAESLFRLSEFGLRTPKAPPPPEPSLELDWFFAPKRPNYTFDLPLSSPLVADGRVYFGSSDSHLHALDADDGRPLWSFPTRANPKGILSSPAGHEGRVYFGAYDGNLYALDGATGKAAWVERGADYIGSSPALAPGLGLLFIGLEYGLASQQGALGAYDLASGRRRWWLPLADFVHGTPLYLERHGLVLVGANDGTVLAAEAATGRLAWSFAAGAAVKASLAHDAARDLVLFGAFDGRIHALEAASGRPRFAATTGGAVYATPLVAGDTAYCPSTDRCLHAVDLDSGARRTVVETLGKCYSSPGLVGGRVMFGSNDGGLRGIDPRSGRTTAYVKVAERLLGRPAGHRDRVLVTGAGGTMLCFRPAAGGAS